MAQVASDRQEVVRAHPSKQAIDQIVSVLMRFSPERIILFGSRARGDWDEHSDIDLIVVYQTDKRFLDRLRELLQAIRIVYHHAVDVLAYTPEEFEMLLKERPFIQDIVQEGETLYERAKQRSDAMV